MGMLLAAMLFNMLLGSGLVTVLGQVHMVLLLVSSMGLLVSVVAVGSSVLVLDLNEVIVNSVDLDTAVRESHLAVCLMDETVELIDLLHASIHDFLLLLSIQFGFESSILLLHLLDLAALRARSFLVVGLLNKLLVVLVMLLGVLVTVLAFHLRVQVNTADLGTALNEEFLAIIVVHKAVVLVGSCPALLVLLLELLLCLDVLLLLSFGLLSFESLLSLGFLLLSCLFFFVHHILMSDMSHASATMCVMLVASVLGQSLRRVVSSLGEVLGGELALRMRLIISSIGSLVGSHDRVGGMVHWLSLLLMVRWLPGVMSLLPTLLVRSVLLGVLRGLTSLLVVGGWLVVLALKVVILFDFVLSEGLHSGGVPLLSLAELLVVLLLSSNCFSAGNVVALVVQGLLFSQGMESVVRGVVRGACAAVVMSLEQGGMSLPWGSSVSDIVAGVSSSSQVSHLLRVALGTMRPHRLLVRSASLMVQLLAVVMGSAVVVSSIAVVEPLRISFSLLVVVSWRMSSHLTMTSWLPHLSVASLFHWALVVSHSIHSAQSLLVSWVGGGHSALHLSPLLGFHGLLLSLDVLLSLLLALVEHVADLAQVVDLGVARVELVVLVGALDHLVPSLLLSHLSLLGLFALILALLGLVCWCLFSLVSILLVAGLLGSGLLLLSFLWLWCSLTLHKLLSSAIIHLFQNIDNDIGLSSV